MTKMGKKPQLVMELFSLEMAGKTSKLDDYEKEEEKEQRHQHHRKKNKNNHTPKLPSVPSTTPTISKPCAVCGKMGTRRAIEILPTGAILWASAHDENNSICRWPEVTDIDQLAKPRNTRGEKPKIKKCPRCNDPGSLVWFTDDSVKVEEKGFSYRYYVMHEKNDTAAGYRRCHVDRPEERAAALKQTGQYIADIPNSAGDSRR